ncbi:hypothetical protein B0T09DRAFT_8096 [Sordaria sp. MPI-SDFR-AT-0083]|nr:hypothetical protein B0T09DRAFT_8096 [Sordaria sp. MPI-SDFR-AT-0083]
MFARFVGLLGVGLQQLASNGEPKGPHLDTKQTWSTQKIIKLQTPLPFSTHFASNRALSSAPFSCGVRMGANKPCFCPCRAVDKTQKHLPSLNQESGFNGLSTKIVHNTFSLRN